MVTPSELRYYEILFIKLINQFFNIYKPDRLKTFLEMAAFVSDASALALGRAMQQVMSNDTSIRIYRDEYIVCLKLYTNLTDVSIRKLVKCSPNTITSVMDTYGKGKLHIVNKMDTEQSLEVYKVMVKLKQIGNIN